MFSKLIAAGAAIGLAAAPLAASAAAPTRSATPVEGEELAGGNGSGATALVVGAIVAALVAGIIIVSDDGDDQPVSP